MNPVSEKPGTIQERSLESNRTILGDVPRVYPVFP